MDNHRKKKDNATTDLKIKPRPPNVIGHIHNDGACPQSTQKKESWIVHKFGESGRVWTFMATSSYGSRLSCVYFPPHFQMVAPVGIDPTTAADEALVIRFADYQSEHRPDTQSVSQEGAIKFVDRVMTMTSLITVMLTHHQHSGRSFTGKESIN